MGVYIGDDNIIYVRMKGNLTSDHRSELEAWDLKVREAMEKVGEANPGKAFCLTDLTGGLEADEMSMNLIKEQILHNKQYITRTAVIGANFNMKTIMYLALAVARRTNMKPFDTKEEAMEWLFNG